MLNLVTGLKVFYKLLKIEVFYKLMGLFGLFQIGLGIMVILLITKLLN